MELEERWVVSEIIIISGWFWGVWLDIRELIDERVRG